MTGALIAWVAGRGRRRCPEGDGGFTLIELLAAMFLFAVILSLISGATIQMQHSLRKEQGQADDLDGARKALELLDHQVRYANAISQPGTNTAGTGRYIEFQNGNTTLGAPQTCFQWRLDTTTQLLQYRTWPVTASAAALSSGGWLTQLTGAVPVGSTQVFATTALARGIAAPVSGPLHASITATFGARHGNPSTTTTNAVTLTAVNTTSVATTTAVCAPTSVDGGAVRP